ncbi:biosynthetic arginine decarboxylase [Idiomarina sp. UBA4520]|jgi:arginine decarboxylase|uniref:biosynthetic arginine decarboxylase n=1 Tax=Idiomarina sp. UBA4520 TaxID=1946647 RepID=UPI000AEF10FC|nr:biosynthetic arginine decarboxylase [Idiomarina sp. UBA4520]MBF39593.1 arginine decarboxylase [Idiomarinaceae bacterium]|tara:strand:+ start:18570 stop:20480 length:1911 start_codon:yes stop_codon:yes gene_type:complete
MSDWNIDQAEELYGVNRWGAGYFSIGENGNIQIRPNHRLPDLAIDMQEVVEEIKAEGIELPAVIRFHDILRSQVEIINETFAQQIQDADYKGKYCGVFPIKVNQMREVVEEIMDAGEPYNYGLEAGSKPELMAVMAYNDNPDALTILNGYKDKDYLTLALLGRQLRRKMIIVIEKYSELEMLIPLAKELGVEPMIGLRSKMMVKSAGKWAGSSGDRAKFGLSIAEILNVIERLRQEDMLHCAKLLHFHIGSQLSDIRKIKEAVSEGARLYAKLIQEGVPLEYLDIGGGLGIDYDGTSTTNDSSRNYSTEEYVADVVWGVKQVCDLEEVPHPNLVSESGRAMTAHHSCVVTNIVGEIKPASTNFDVSPSEDEHILVKNMRELHQSGDQFHPQERYNDAAGYKQNAYEAFKLGILSLQEMAKLDTMYWQILADIHQSLDKDAYVIQELEELEDMLASQYLCNFSIFQSAADTWAIGQVLPIVPISRLNEKPEVRCSIADITCDSDGKLGKYIEGTEISDNIPMHSLRKGEDYHVGLFLTGAYQDVMGDMHNLFGRLTEVHVYCHDDERGDFYIEEVVPGTSAEKVLQTMQYNTEYMAKAVKKQIDRQVRNGGLAPRAGVRWTNFYEKCLAGSTYLSVE